MRFSRHFIITLYHNSLIILNLKQMGGMSGLQNMMRQLQQGGMSGLQNMMGSFGGKS
jgi:hypothetical protein